MKSKQMEFMMRIVDYDQFEVVLPATLRAAKCYEDLSNTGTIQ